MLGVKMGCEVLDAFGAEKVKCMAFRKNVMRGGRRCVTDWANINGNSF